MVGGGEIFRGDCISLYVNFCVVDIIFLVEIIKKCMEVIFVFIECVSGFKLIFLLCLFFFC